MPLVSVVIPNYNTAHYLSEAIESVLASTFKDFEVIVIDDGSEDNSEDIIKAYIDLPNFRFITQKNKGLAGARNTGIKAAVGKYLVFLDSDDIILPDKLKEQVTFLELNQQVDVVYSSSIFFKDTALKPKIFTGFPNYSGHILKNLLYGNFIHVNAIMVRREAVVDVGMFDESLRELEDWDLWLRMSLAGSQFEHQDRILSEVRLRKGSMTSNQMKMNATMVRVLEKNLLSLKKGKRNEKDLIKCAFEALFLFKLQAEQKSKFNTQILRALQEVGISFLPIASKLFIKRYLSILLKFENRTTRSLERIWDE